MLGSTITIHIAGCQDAGLLYEAIKHTQPHLIRMGNDAVPTAVQYVFKNDTPRAELLQLGNSLAKQIGRRECAGVKIIVVRSEVNDNIISVKAPHLGRQYPYTATSIPAATAILPVNQFANRIGLQMAGTNLVDVPGYPTAVAGTQSTGIAAGTLKRKYRPDGGDEEVEEVGQAERGRMGDRGSRGRMGDGGSRGRMDHEEIRG